MTKIRNNLIQCDCSKQNSAPLDKLAQLRQHGSNASNSVACSDSHLFSDNELKTDAANKSESKKTYIKRQRSKYISNAMALSLINEHSHLEKSYWRTYNCSSELHQDGNKVTTKYCKNRWCIQCSRIRMAQFIKGYSAPLLSLPDLHFMTLTCPNYTYAKRGVNEMNAAMRKIMNKVRRSTNHTMQGVRKLECTLSKRGNYNLHFHLLMNDEDTCHLVQDLWLDNFPKAVEAAQDLRRADEGSLIELFKYAAKGMTKAGRFDSKRLDALYQALYRKRIVQPFGINKDVSEDLSGLESQIIDFKEMQQSTWTWQHALRDWMNDEGELFTGFILNGSLDEIIQNIA